MARKFQPEESSGGVASWMVTYGDLMSLLLTFFVLLVSFSTIQEAKFYEAIQSLQGAFGVLKNPPTALEFNELLVPNLSKQERSEILHEFGKLEQSLLDEGLDTEVDIRMTGEGIAFQIDDSLLFGSGRADLRPKSHPVLDRLAAFLAKFHQDVEITGHTDALPMSSVRFPSNWELSAARAIAVARHIQARGIDPRRIRATGFGEFRPVADNDSAEGRARNRRVELFLKLSEPRRDWIETLPLEPEEN